MRCRKKNYSDSFANLIEHIRPCKNVIVWSHCNIHIKKYLKLCLILKSERKRSEWKDYAQFNPASGGYDGNMVIKLRHDKERQNHKEPQSRNKSTSTSSDKSPLHKTIIMQAISEVPNEDQKIFHVWSY